MSLKDKGHLLFLPIVCHLVFYYVLRAVGGLATAYRNVSGIQEHAFLFSSFSDVAFMHNLWT